MKVNRFDFTGKTAVITGASRGLGKAFAEALADSGANIVVVNTNIKTGQPVADELAEKYGVKTLAIQTDVTDYDQVNEMARKAREAFGVIDICIANAGKTTRLPATECPPEVWKDIVNTNLTGVFFTDQAIGKIMVEQKKGSIINIASIRAHTASHPQNGCVYPATKAGIVMLTKTLAKEWGPYNVRVNAISPGYMHTDINADASDYVHAWEEMTAMKRLGRAEELQSTALYLASDYSSYTTGTEILVDGGFTTF